MNLNKTILDAAKDEVARENGFDSWEGCMELTTNYTICFQFHEQASLLAMDRQAEFYRHISRIGWILVDEDFDGMPIYEMKTGMGPDQTELELYNIWRRDAETH